MKHKNIFACALLFTAVLFIVTGCATPCIPEGRYSNTACDDYVLVNNDLIFLHIRAPYEHPSNLAYWQWAGKYKLNKDGRILPDMDVETGKLWRFYYDFKYDKNAIRVHDIGEGRAFSLIAEDPIRR